MDHRSAVVLAWLFLVSCADTPEVETLLGEDHALVVATRNSQMPYARWAQHTEIYVKDGPGDAWENIEVRDRNRRRTDGASGEVEITRRPGVMARPKSSANVSVELRQREIRLLCVLRGEEAEPVIRDLRRKIDEYAASDNGYRRWPGPNSNSFLDWLAREVSGVAVDLDHNAVGKDFAHWLRLGATSTKTGIEFETMLLGLQTGLVEGIELHFLQLTFGLALFPPALKLPFAPRLGFPPLVLGNW